MKKKTDTDTTIRITPKNYKILRKIAKEDGIKKLKPMLGLIIEEAARLRRLIFY